LSAIHPSTPEAALSITFASEGSKPDVVVVPVFQPPKNTDDISLRTWDALIENMPSFAVDTDNQKAALYSLVNAHEFKGKAGQTLLIPNTPAAISGGGPKKILVVGLGDPKTVTPAATSQTLQKALEALPDKKPHVSVVLPEATRKINSHQMTNSIVAAVNQATYYANYGVKTPVKQVASLSIEALSPEQLNRTLKNAVITAQARSLAQDAGGAPYAQLSIQKLISKYVRPLGQQPHMSVEIKNASWIHQNMPEFDMVAQGNRCNDSAAVVKITYTPPMAMTKKLPLWVKGSCLMMVGPITNPARVR
jgi:hypothetical protein